MVVLDVQPACGGAALWGGVLVGVRDDATAAEARGILREICDTQTRVASEAVAARARRRGEPEEDAEDGAKEKEEKLAVAIANAFPTIAFPEDREKWKVDPDALAEAWAACEGERRGDAAAEAQPRPGLLENAELWFCKKPFRPDEPLSKQVSISAKTKLRVFLAPGDRFDACSDDAQALEHATQLIKTTLETIPREAWVHAKDSDRPSESKTTPAAATNSSRKRPRESVDLSFMKGRALDSAVHKLCDEMGFRLKKGALERLDKSSQIQNYMRDPRLVSLLVEIEQASNKMKTLEDCMDRDAGFAQFIDQMLSSIGAQRVVEHRDGRRTIESCLENVIESTRPSFLLSAGAAKVSDGEDDDDNEVDKEDNKVGDKEGGDKGDVSENNESDEQKDTGIAQQPADASGQSQQDATNAPTTEVPTTDAPTIDASTTNAPTTDAPTAADMDETA